MRNHSLVQAIGKRNKSSCGYCSKENTSLSYGIWAHILTCEHYQELLNRGWRRSGKYLYKPDQMESCCAQYTLRLNTQKFKLTKSYKKIIATVKQEVQKSILATQRKPKSENEEDEEDSFNNEEVSSSVDTLFPAQSTSGNTNGGESGVDEDNHFADLKDLIKKAERSDLPGGLKVILEPASNSAEKFELYKKYQIAVHHEDPSEISHKQFFRFLVDNPLEPYHHESSQVLFGAQHQLYYLGNRLIAFGVLDILPFCVSSVYFVYDPDFAHMGLGKYSALREIMLTQSLNEKIEDLSYYCMGFYIHTCPKMRYKGQYKPSELLDPVSYEWYPLELCQPLLDQDKFFTFADMAIVERLKKFKIAPGTLDPGRLPEFDMAKIRLVTSQGWVYLGEMIGDMDENTREDIREFVAAVGLELAHKMYLFVPDL